MSDRGNSGAKPESQNTPPNAGTPEKSGGSAGGNKAEKPEPKIGLERFLQKFPRDSGITALLRLKHKADVKTIPEWEAVIKGLLEKKVQ